MFLRLKVSWGHHDGQVPGPRRSWVFLPDGGHLQGDSKSSNNFTGSKGVIDSRFPPYRANKSLSEREMTRSINSIIAQRHKRKMWDGKRRIEGRKKSCLCEGKTDSKKNICKKPKCAIVLFHSMIMIRTASSPILSPSTHICVSV